MSKGEWVPAKHEDIRKGDVVRVTTKDGPQTIIVEGKVTSYDPNGRSQGEPSWCVENFESYYSDEFEPVRDSVSTLEKFVPEFEWPTKLGAVVMGKWDGRSADDYQTFVRVMTGEKHCAWFHVEGGNFYGTDELGRMGMDYRVVESED